MFSNNPKLGLEKMLVFGALGYYVFRHLQLQKAGDLKGEPELVLKVDRNKVFDVAEKQLKMNPNQRKLLEGVLDAMIKEEE